MKRKFLSLLLSLSLLAGLSVPALAAETASVIRLTKTTGTVEISKSSGKSVSLLKNMRLYNGYHVSTEEESYAWINLDDSKLLKEDAESEVEVRKDGKNLEILVSSGNLFFDVAEPLEDDESMNIRTSTTIVGIRGTSGWIEVLDRWTTRISVLEGVVECSVADSVTGQLKAEKVYGGETATCVVYPREQTGDKCDILREKFTVDDIPGFVLTDLTRDIPLCDKIEEATGLDIPRDLASVAGGDPSGRTPDRENATSEVLGEADRREDEDEDELHKKLEEIEKELAKQPNKVSPSKPIEKPAPPADSGSDRDDDSGSSGGNSDGGSTTPTPEPTPDPAVYTITFDANGGTASAASASTGADGKLASLPSASYGGLTFDGWYTALSGGTKVDETTAFTADTTVYARWSGWSLDGGVLTIAGSGPMGDYPIISDPDEGVWNDAPWCGANNMSYLDIQTVVIKEGVTTIGEGAFFMCENLTSVTIPEGVTSIGINAFSSCDSLASVEIPSSVTSIESSAFSSCSSLTSVTIPSGVTSMATDAFRYSENLSSITVDGANSAYCSVNGVVLDRNQTAVILCPEGHPGPTYEVPASVTRIGEGAFQNCGSLTGVNLPEGITSIESSAFNWCTGLSSITIPSNVTSIGANAFEGCTSLTGAVIPDGITSIERGLFNSCQSLASVTIPNSVTSIGAGAFRNCSSLTSISIPTGVTSIGSGAFVGCTGLTGITIPDGVTSIERDTFSGCSGLTSFTIPSRVTSIGSGAFQYCTALTDIVIPNGVEVLKAYTFNDSGLRSITIPASVTEIENALDRCNNLTSITFNGSVAQWNTIDKSSAYIPTGIPVTCIGGSTTT